MPFVSRHQRVPVTALISVILLVTPESVWLGADVRQVSVASLIYDLKHPDAIRRQVAARELGAARYRPAIRQLVALANDPVGAVRREVEFSLERMNDVGTLAGFIALASDTE